ncbi:MAG: terminase small subunit [Oscillospiraceae bacterium]|nr:terminase small subunit [Oscillospiraceae bacterium]
MELSSRKRRFVEEYLVDLNATQAAVRAGYSAKSAEKHSYRLLKDPAVAEAVREAMGRRSARTEITQDMVIRELAAIAFAKVTDHTNVAEDGAVRVIPTEGLTEAQRRAIAGIKVSRYGVTVSNYDKVKALELLGKHLGMFGGKEESGPVENDLVEKLLEQTEEDMDTDDLPEIQ